MAASSQQLLPLLRSTRRPAANNPGQLASAVDHRAADHRAADHRAAGFQAGGRPGARREKSSGTIVRWGAALVEPGPAVAGAQAHAWEHLSSRNRRGRRTTVWVDQLARSRSSRQSVDLRSIPLTKAARVQGASAAASATAVAGTLHEGAQSGSTARGGSFAHRRTIQALELTAACVMIVAFLAVAMFV